MAFRFLHLGINFKTKTATTETIDEVQKVLSRAKDWYRYTPNCWIIYTSTSPKEWNERLKAIPWMKDQSYFICPLDLTDKSGWLIRDTWDWLNKSRE